ncbi:MAG: RNA polymerase sigma factor [Prevotella sp.]|jgi:RNA polymerase sigma-70 factor (ECF subfamily)|nr:RNA polymerase sigma factor [Prevotella sp.]MCI2079432.1 RNA polymerase sigma factor [Prevotella sp.]MCI2101308.1 RNA polymerase sigma factor [Prevotella sp.]
MKKISFRNDVLPLKNQLYRLALRITLDSTDAEDIVQETLIKVWDKRESWESIESIEAFSLTICRNLALDHIKRQDHQNDSLDDSTDNKPDQSSNPDEQMIQRDRINLVKRLVDQLPEKQRSCMQLRDFEGKSYKEIAQVLGITEEQVKVNIFRARQTVKNRFKEYDNYGL